MPDIITICPATAADAPLLAALAAKTFYDTYAQYNTPADMQDYITNHFTVSHIEQEISDPRTHLLLAWCNEKMAGYAKLVEGPVPYIPEIPALEIARYYVDSDFQGRGVGRKLMAAITDAALSLQCHTLWLGVWQRNTRAVDIYRHLGFRIAGTTTFQLGSDLQEDFVMVKEL